ncbi:hypothetical protein CW676_02060 [Macrococcoides caseolyticum]|uniref:hypothetical protein n=1 Tax=Macrococcoides caseolyticum TaxID=69966 RepID=UPI000C333AA9|nr:hypothetical protein [Macrococcus caseolyticus]PKE07301.1 hypothetical protein CW692_03290 [Macrococcus caseolyticus]PKE54042.1 hypothetical protein CW676_02060 [Macrococcus caseolyticus]PKF39125.1 hypothetical protein CW681_02390 [Macrococcus caseolyticus]
MRTLKSVKPLMHFYYPEASKKGKKIRIDEYFYITNSLNDYIIAKNFEAKHYAESDKSEFKKSLKKNNNDRYYIIFDVDFKNKRDINKVRDDLKKNTREFIKLANQKSNDLKIILSSRAFETYLNMFNRQQYTKPYFDMNQLMKDIIIGAPYSKHESWYEINAKELHDNSFDTYIPIQNSRAIVFQNNHSPIRNHNVPDYFNDSHVNFLASTAPYTYFDLLLNDLM